MTEVELKNAIEELSHEISRLANKRGQLLDELVLLVCPYKVGDRLERKTTRGHGNKKKDIIEVWEITKAVPGWHVGDYNLVGKKVLKNGSLETSEHRIYHDLDEFKRVNVVCIGKF